MTALCFEGLFMVVAADLPIGQASLSETTSDIIKAAIALIVAILVLGVGIILAKRKSARKQEEEESPQVVYSLHDLRRMLARHEITPEEVGKLKDVVSTQTRKTGHSGD